MAGDDPAWATCEIRRWAGTGVLLLLLEPTEVDRRDEPDKGREGSRV